MLKNLDRRRAESGYNIVTLDETWISSYEPESKQQTTVWEFNNSLNSSKVHGAFSRKCSLVYLVVPTGHVASILYAEWYTIIYLITTMKAPTKYGKQMDI